MEVTTPKVFLYKDAICAHRRADHDSCSGITTWKRIHMAASILKSASMGAGCS